MSEMKEYFSICPKCKKGIAHSINDGKHCEHCGAVLLKKCPGCEKAILSGEAVFCRFCGINYLSPGKSLEKV